MTSKLYKVFFAMLALLASPMVLAAEPVWTIYTPAAGSAIFDILTGVAGMMQRGGEASLIGAVLTVSLVSFVALVARAGLEGNFVRVLTFFLSLWVLLTTTFSIKVPLMVADRVSNYYNVVENVPLILAAPAAFISQIGDSVSEKADTWMSMPDELSMYRGGQFNLFAKVLADSHTFKIVDPGLQQSLNNYTNDCVIPSIARGAISLSELKTSKDLWRTMQVDHKSLMTRVRVEPTMVTGLQLTAPTASSGSGGATSTTTLCSVSDTSGCSESLTTCTQAYSIIGAALERYVSEFGKGGAGLKDLAAAGGVGALAGSLSAAATWLMGDSGDIPAPGQLLQQRIMVNAMSGTFRAAAVQAGNDALLQAAATTQVEEAQKSTWIASASLFNDLMGYIFVVLQAMIYALAPFALLMLFAPGSGIRGAITYLQMLVWVALWQPLITVINFIIAVLGRSTIASSFGTGFDMTNAVAVSEAANNLMAAAGFMGSMVPLLAWKVATGSFGLMEFVQQGSGQGSAAQAGSTASSGNLTLGQVGMNNISANSAKLTNSTEFGEIPLTHKKAGPGAISTVSELGGSSTGMNGGLIQSTVSNKLSAQQAAALKETAAHQLTDTIVSSTAASAASTQSDMRQHTAGRETNNGTTRSAQSSVSDNTSNQLSLAAGAVISSLASESFQHGYRGSLGADVGFGLGGRKTTSQDGGGQGPSSSSSDSRGWKFNVGADGSITMSSTTSLQDSSTASIDRKSTLGKAITAANQVTGASTFGYSEKDGFTATYQSGETYNLSAQESKQAAEAYQRGVDASYTQSLSHTEEKSTQRNLPVADGVPLDKGPSLGSPALQSAIKTGDTAALLNTSGPLGAPAGVKETRDAAHNQLSATRGKVASDTIKSGVRAPTGDSLQTSADAALQGSLRKGQSAQVLSKAQEADLKKPADNSSRTGGHTWDADDRVKHDMKGTSLERPK